MSKKCKNCNAELPEDASFCPHCAKSQIERTEVRGPRLWRKKTWYVLLCVVVLAGAVLAVSLYHRPKVFEGGVSVTYTDKEGTYELFLAFSPGDIVHHQPVGSKTVKLSVNEGSGDTPVLGIYQNGEIADTEQFFEKVESCTMEAFPNENSALGYAEPMYSTDFQPAARVCTIQYTGASGKNELVWTLHMKNGDTICLKQTFEVIPLVHQSFTAEEAPLDTTEDLEALLERIDAEVPADTIVDIYLPPVTYTGNLSIHSRAVNLYGCTDGSGRTTFNGTISVYSHNPSNVMLFDLDFVGNGGTGLLAEASVYMGGCSFTGWDVGAMTHDDGMISVENCEFRNNGIGFKYDSANFSSFKETFPGCTIADNDIGIQFERLDGTSSIDFAGSVFSGNETDIDNPVNYPIHIENAVFE